MEKIESPPQAPAPVLSESAGRPIADDVLTRDVYVEEHAVDGQAFHSRHAVVLRTRACLGAMYMAVLVCGYWILKHLAHQNAETHLFGWAIAGIFVLLGTCSERPIACRWSRLWDELIMPKGTVSRHATLFQPAHSSHSDRSLPQRCRFLYTKSRCMSSITSARSRFVS